MQNVRPASRSSEYFSRRGGFVFFVLALMALWALPADAQIGGHQKISDAEGGLSEALKDGDRFGQSAARLGDLDGDGNSEVAVGAAFDDGGATKDTDRGAIYILFLGDDGTVKKEQKVNSVAGGFGGTLPDNSHFGRSITRIGDVNGDGVQDLAVGAEGDDDGGTDRGAVWILFLNSDGTVADQQKISDAAGSFGGALVDGAQFGESVTGIGNLDRSGAPDLAVGAPCGDGTSCRGAVWILFLKSDGTVSGSQKISDTEGGFGGTLTDNDNFGKSLARLGDFDGNGAPDIVVGAWKDDDGNTDRGAVWVLFLNDDGSVADQQKISDTQGGFTGTLSDNDSFGTSVARLADLNGDKVPDLVVGAKNDEDGGPSRGAVWVLYMNLDGTAADQQKISDTQGGFTGTLSDNDSFGTSVSSVGDLSGDGVPDFAAGATGDDDGGGSNRGALWVLHGDQALLPVELASFRVVSAGNDAVDLRWRTASETGNAGFEVQHRSGVQAAWSKIEFVESKASGGTTTEAKDYRFTAKGLEMGIHQFRLKQIDLDGGAHFHGPVTVELRMQEALRLSAPAPNPVRGQATLSFAVKEQVETTLTLYNVLGQEVRTLYTGTPAAGEIQTARLEASALSSGVYILRLQAEGRSKTRQLTVVQ